MDRGKSIAKMKGHCSLKKKKKETIVYEQSKDKQNVTIVSVLSEG